MIAFARFRSVRFLSPQLSSEHVVGCRAAPADNSRNFCSSAACAGSPELAATLRILQTSSELLLYVRRLCLTAQSRGGMSLACRQNRADDAVPAFLSLTECAGLSCVHSRPHRVLPPSVIKTRSLCESSTRAAAPKHIQPAA